MPKATNKIEEKRVDAGDYIRPTWDEYFMQVVEAISKRATCNRGRTGCVIVKDHQILVTGYVGSAAGDDHCDDVGHMYQKRLNPDGTTSEHCVRTIHAEQNAIAQAAKRGVSVDGATIYMKLEPCPVCAKILVNAGIKQVICQKRYHAAEETRRVFDRCGVQLIVLDDEVMQYDRQ
ncbi:MAG: tRNA-specific adenosine deaminase [bacterium ADurb.Bin400]|nr:MAG: tRNA-specific adenosine deaminase [bacterium ADurb.Bin400]